MAEFLGFPNGKIHPVPVPEPFFSELLPQITDLGELKICLYIFWALDQQSDSLRYVSYADMQNDEILMNSFDTANEKAKSALQDALERAVQRGTLLKALPEDGNAEAAIYFINSPRGRAAIQALDAGEWSPKVEEHHLPHLAVEQPNIFRLYEANIGPLTPMIADELQEAERTYPLKWIEDAIRIAVENNVRRWRYVEAILRSWQERGPDEENRRDSQKNRRKYIEGEFGEFVEH